MKKSNLVTLLSLCFLVVAVIDCIIMIFVDIPTLEDIIICFPNLAYMGFVSCSIAYTFQIVGQKYISPTIGALLMSLESVFSVLSEWALQGNLLAPLKILGCVIIFAAVILVQLPERKKQA